MENSYRVLTEEELENAPQCIANLHCDTTVLLSLIEQGYSQEEAAKLSMRRIFPTLGDFALLAETD